MNSGIEDCPPGADARDVEDPFDRDLSVRTLTWLVTELALPPGSAGPEIEVVCRRLGAVVSADQAGTVVAAVVHAQRSLIEELRGRAGAAERAVEAEALEIAELRGSLESTQDQVRRLRRRNRILRRRLDEIEQARSIRVARAVGGRIRRTRGAWAKGVVDSSGPRRDQPGGG